MYKKSLLFAVFLLIGCSKPEDTKSKPEVAKASVSFITNGGNDITMQTLNSGSSLKETTPINKGFLFAGWYYDEDFLLPFNYSNAINQDINLYANWKPSVLNASFTLHTSNMKEIISFPHNMLFDDSGNLFLSTDDGIYKITTSGAISSFVKGKYWGMSFDSKGNLFALKPENTLSNIDKIDVNGNATPFLKVDFFASNLFFDKKNGNLFINDFSYGRLEKIDLSSSISEFASGYGIISNFTIGPFGDYYLSSYSSISKINLKGRNVSLATLNSPPTYIICDGRGNIYTGNIDGSISKITPTGAVVYFKIDGSYGGYGGLTCMTMDKDENIYLTLSNSNGDNGYINTIIKITY